MTTNQRYIGYFECLRWAQDTVADGKNVFDSEVAVSMHAYAVGLARGYCIGISEGEKKTEEALNKGRWADIKALLEKEEEK